MFNYSIDTKGTIVDPKNNTIVDLTKSIFAKHARYVKDYEIKYLDETFNMRPDLVSIAEYGDETRTEYILKYSGISNPFSFCDDDVLMIPSDTEAYGMMAVNNPEQNTDESANREAQIRNYFKFVNQDYKSDSTSYNDLKNKKISSGIIDITKNSGNVMVPYISEDGRTAVTIRNGRMYFGEDAGLNIASATNLTEKIQTIINNTATTLSDSNCMHNGSKLVDFVRANHKQNK